MTRPRPHPEDDSVYDPRAWIGARSRSVLDTGWFSEAGEQPADVAWRSNDAGIGDRVPLGWLGVRRPWTALNRYVRNPMYTGVFGVFTWRGSNLPLHATPGLCRIPPHCGTTVCRLLRRTHAPPPVRRFVPAISPLRPALDAAAL